MPRSAPLQPRLCTFPLLNLIQNDPFQTLGLRRTRPPAHHAPILAHQKLLKVPLDPLQPKQAGGLLLQEFEQGLGGVTVDLRLAEDGEADAVVDEAEVLDSVVVAWVLRHELVAGEAEDDELVRVRGGDLLVQGLERGELRGEAAFAGGVDDEDDFVAEGGEGEGLAFFY